MGEASCSPSSFLFSSVGLGLELSGEGVRATLFHARRLLEIVVWEVVFGSSSSSISVEIPGGWGCFNGVVKSFSLVSSISFWDSGRGEGVASCVGCFGGEGAFMLWIVKFPIDSIRILSIREFGVGFLSPSSTSLIAEC